MIRTVKRLRSWSVIVGAAIFSQAILSGCVEPQRREVMLEAPVIERAPVPTHEPTLLEKYQEVSQLHAAARIELARLTRQLASESGTCKRLEEQIKAGQQRVKVLEGKSKQLDEVVARHDAAQAELLRLGKTVREVRHELLQERLARIKLEQQLVALKLKNAREKRQQLLGQTTIGTEMQPDEKEKDEKNG